MAQENSTSTRGENPRTRRVRKLMLETAVGLLVNEGAGEVTAARVAEEADVARTTVYRQWPDQPSLLLATVQELTTPPHPMDFSGPVEDDVRRTLEGLRERCRRRKVRTVFGTLAGHSPHDAAFREAQLLFVQQLAQPVVDALEAGMQRGELARSTDCVAEANLLAGPLLYCHLALHETISDDLISEVVARWQGSRPGA
jgi:AcrR family transcriptional regulator